jgi:hypothetical protein
VTVAMLLLCFLILWWYRRMAVLFQKSYNVEINGHRISPWACSAVFMLWVLGMAYGIYLLSFIPLIFKRLLALA